jgi:hypothetical protein
VREQLLAAEALRSEIEQQQNLALNLLNNKVGSISGTGCSTTTAAVASDTALGSSDTVADAQLTVTAVPAMTAAGGVQSRAVMH